MMFILYALLIAYISLAFGQLHQHVYYYYSLAWTLHTYSPLIFHLHRLLGTIEVNSVIQINHFNFAELCSVSSVDST